MTEKIWNEFNNELLGFVKSKINDTEIAKDILQEVFIKIHKNKNSLKENEKISSWVYQITRNTIIDYYRKKKNNKLQIPVEDIFPEKLEEKGTDFSNCVKPFLKKLSKQDKELLEAINIKGISQKKYAQDNGLSYSTVKSRVQRARQKLKLLFLECCDIESDNYGNVMSYSQKKCTNC